MRRIVLSFVLLVLLGGFQTPCRAETFVLVDQGQATSEIVLPREPTKSAQLAAYELREHIRLITGAELAIVDEDDEGDGIKLHVGDTRAARAAGLSQGQFLNQEYAVRRVPGGIVLAGKDDADAGEVVYKKIPEHAAHEVYDYLTWPSLWSERGTLHAAYAFLRTACGVRWFDPTDFGTDYESRKTLEVSVSDLRTRPAFAHRNFFAGYDNAEFYDSGTSPWHSLSAGYAKWEQNAYAMTREKFASPNIYRNIAKRGLIRAFLYRHLDGGERYRCNHSLYGHYPRFWQQDSSRPGIFVARKPEWFAQGYDDLPRPPQMCFSNDELAAQVAQDADHWFSGQPISPNSGMPITVANAEYTPDYFPVVPMDNGFWCKCEKCQADLHPRSGGDLFSSGIASDHVWPFVNKVARQLKTTHPGKMIAALAYASYAFPPSGLQLEDNISVQLCLGVRAVYDLKAQAADDAMLALWRETGDRPIFLWLYYCFPAEWSKLTKNPDTWHFFPGFFAHSISKAFKKYQAQGVRGMFFNGIGHEVENYITLRLLQDPNLDVDALLDEYFSRMYGPAGGPIGRFYATIEEIYSDPKNHFTTGAANAWEFQGTVPRMAEMALLIQEAEAAAVKATPIQKKRLEIFRLAIWDYLVEGKRKHNETLKAKRVLGYCPAVSLEAPGDIDAVNWARDGQHVDGDWRQDTLDGSRRVIKTHALHDGQFLHLNLRELNPTSTPKAGDCWKILLASPGNPAVREIMVSADGSHVAQGIEEKRVRSKTQYKDGVWDVYVAVALADFVEGDNGNVILFNVIRLPNDGEDDPILSSTAGNIHDTTRYARLTLGEMPTASEAQPLDEEGLILKWTFDGDGRTVVDQSPMDNDGVLSNDRIERKDWPGGKSVHLTPAYPGERRYVELDSPKGFEGLSSLTLSFWVKVAHHPTYNRPPEYYTLIDADNGLYLDLRPEGIVFLKAGERPVQIFAPVRSVTPDEWAHLVVTFGDGKLNIYVNGRLSRSAPYKLDLGDSPNVFRVGQLLKPMNHFQFTGELGEVAIFTRALSAGEVATLYSAKDKGLIH